ncbi:ZIP family metal transporter [Caldivirga maquilingensis]|uniref:Zinc transporter, ZIP family n=1 Tax=Caldivirga maquilingensis (strain ATCC 700844 / DSM 13496 / JCM 10307 / IC-167) TaxID=397948 RepID=A8MC15_CALMQ|nr:ZIP family zinc transporter [Caldivirga maquilingensis]ABW02799.1 zinc transporter, ZIP family [Caldivirga maquilingensis IC-167]
MVPLIALIMGLYAGLTVYLGFSIVLLRRISMQRLGFMNAIAGGLLGYLFVELAMELVEKSEELASEGLWWDYTVFIITTSISLLCTLALLSYIERRIKRNKASWSRLGYRLDPSSLSTLLAVGLGIHNLGEGLGIGSALALTNLGLAALLSIGFAVHNATEGFAISAPLLASRVINDSGDTDAKYPLNLPRRLLVLGAVAGLPTTIGALALSAVKPNELLIMNALAVSSASIIYATFNVSISALGQLKEEPFKFWLGIFLGVVLAILVETILAILNINI